MTLNFDTDRSIDLIPATSRDGHAFYRNIVERYVAGAMSWTEAHDALMLGRLGVQRRRNDLNAPIAAQAPAANGITAAGLGV